MDPLLRRLRRLTAVADRDGVLLARYAATGDPAAVEELVRRHGPTVWAAARRRLPDPADAADVFQATFLVLLQKGGRLTAAGTVGPWLYRVAAHTARNLRRRNARRLARRRPLLDVAAEPDLALRTDLDDALLTLSERDRAAVVLCHLQGYSRQEAAERLGLPAGTLSSALSRALAKLRRRLGDDPLPLLAAGTLAVPGGVATAAIQTATMVRAASLTAACVEVASLTREAMRMFWLKKVAASGMAVAACLGLAVGVGLAPRPAVADPPKAAPPAKPAPAADPDPADDGSYPITLSPEEVRECPKLAVEANGLRLETGPVAVVPIVCKRGVTGAVVIGPGTFRFAPPAGEPMQGQFRAAVLRFNPKEWETLVPLAGAKKVTDAGATELARHLLRSVLVHCWQSGGKEVLIPTPGSLAAVLYSKDHGDLLISGDKSGVVVHNFTTGKTLSGGK